MASLNPEFWAILEARIPEASMAMGLARTSAVLDALGHPEHNYRVVLIAGTNGKGSTARFLEQIALSSGLRVGCFSSPHIFSPQERVRINGQDIPEPVLVDLLSELMQRFPELTYFELFTLAATVYFQRQRADLGIFEIGLGGRLDACNALTRVDAAAVTSIGLDHMHLLGSTLTEIAMEKVAIARPGTPLVVGSLPGDARAVVTQYAHDIGAPLIMPEALPMKRPAVPAYLRDNLALACTLARALALDVPRDSGWVLETRPFGRWTVLSPTPLKVLDGGHNRDGVAAALQALKDVGGELADASVYLAVAGTKDLSGMVECFAEYPVQIVAVQMEGERWHAAESVRSLLSPSHRVDVLSCREALATFADAAGPVLWLGSVRALEIFAGMRRGVV